MTLNPNIEPRADLVIRRETYHHPRFDAAAMVRRKSELWALQGDRNTWFCGAYFGAGFHEDGLQAGLAVAEALGGAKRPWSVAGEVRSYLFCRRGQKRRSESRSHERRQLGAIPRHRVMHQRLRPRRHRLRYRIFSLLLDLDELDGLAARLWLFSHNRFNLFSFADRDHGNGSTEPLRAQIEHQLTAAGIAPDGGPIRLLTMPRVLGYVFNPLSVYFCYRRAGALAAIVYEVNNTFGERHNYLVPVSGESTGMIYQECVKQLFVSPFLDTEMNYSFRVRFRRKAVWALRSQVVTLTRPITRPHPCSPAAHHA